MTLHTITNSSTIGLTYGVRPGRRMTDAQRAWLGERMRGRSVAIVGGTGAVGLETLALFVEAGVDASSVHVFASERSAGREIEIDGVRWTVGATDPGEIASCDAAILALDAALSRELAPRLVERGVLVVDHSSAFRMDPATPLVIPEINGSDLAGARLVASPNCTTTIAMMPADAIRREFGLESMGVVSYQAASGAGLAALEGLERECRAALADDEPAAGFFPVPAAFNVFPHESAIAPGSRSSGEEVKIARESRRMWKEDSLAVEATCVRVPVFRTHTVALRLVLRSGATIAEIEGAVRAMEGVELLDSSSPAPTSLGATGRCVVLAGRVKPADPTAEADGEHRVVSLVAAGDQLLKGSAWNGVQIAASM